MELLKNKYYTASMYILILIILVIIFNITGITGKISAYADKSEKIFTGFAVSESQNIINSSIPVAQEQELYSERAYGIYYLIILSIAMLISLVLVTFIIPRIKHLT
ncbi:MAG: hypothetical protein AABX54_04655 [Nanoarchaeota archaeon]